MAIAPIFSQQMQAFDPGRLMTETEEERRRRLEQEAQARGEVIPVKQTITTDPITGQQQMKIEGSVQDLSAANPFTPTVIQPAGPVAPDLGPTPDELMREQEQRRQYQQMMAQPAAAPGLGPTPDELMREQEQRRQYQQMMAQPAAAPVAPGQAGGVTPDEVLREQEQRRQYDLMMARPATTAVTPEQMAQGQGPQPVIRYGQPIPEAPAREPAAAAGQPASAGNVIEFGYPGTQPAAPTRPAAPTQLAQAPTGTRTDVVAGTTGQIAQQPPPQTEMQKILALQNDRRGLLALAGSGTLAPENQRLVETIIRDQLTQDRDLARGTDRVNQAIQSGNPGEINRMLKDKREGSIFRAILFGYTGAKELANEELNKLGYGGKYMTVNIDGEQAYVKTTAQGQPLEGMYLTGPKAGRALSDTELMAGIGRGPAKFKPDVSTQDVEATIGGKVVKGRVVTTYDQNNNPQTEVESGGKRYTYDDRWKPVAISTAAEKAVAQKQINLAYDPIIRAATTSAEELTKANIKYGTNFAVVGRDTNNQPLIVDQNTNQLVRPNAQGQITATVIPGGTQALEIRGDIARTTGQEFVKANVENAKVEANKASGAPGLLRAVDNIIRNAEQRPDFFNSLQTPAYRAFVAAQDAEKQARLEDLSNVARIAEKDRRAFQELMNDVRRLELAGITQSGLTASQLNTERESQRVINSFAVNMRDTPQAARIQAEIARATIEYQREFAKFIGRADPAQNPARIRSDFDDRIGDKIWKDLEPKLRAIRDGGVVDLRSNR